MEIMDIPEKRRNDILNILLSKKDKISNKNEKHRYDINDWRASKKFRGNPPPIEYLIDKKFPIGKVGIIAAAGGTGKSFMLLSLCRDVADRTEYLATSHFGGLLKRKGTAIYLSGEDDSIDIHNRLVSLGGSEIDRLICLPMPDLGGSKYFFIEDDQRKPNISDEWNHLVEQLEKQKDLALFVIDPLQKFTSLDLNNAVYAQFCCDILSHTAKRLNIIILVSHHVRKDNSPIDSHEKMRNAIRGSSAITDGVRFVYGIWNCNPKMEASKNLMKSGLKKRDIIHGAIVKTNGFADYSVSTYMRNESGVISDSSGYIQRLGLKNLDEELVKCIGAAELAGHPYTCSGATGLWKRRGEMSEELRGLSKGRFDFFISNLLEDRLVIQGKIDGCGKTNKWLGVPGGPIEKGEGFLETHGAFKIEDLN